MEHYNTMYQFDDDGGFRLLSLLHDTSGLPHPTRVSTAVEGDELRIRLCNNGKIIRMEDWSFGKGVHNIKTRMAELDGQASWSVDSDVQSGERLCCLRLSVPLSKLSSL